MYAQDKCTNRISNNADVVLASVFNQHIEEHLDPEWGMWTGVLC